MNEITYRQSGDYLIPELEYPEMDLPPLGRYGRMRKNYLREHRPVMYNQLVMMPIVWRSKPPPTAAWTSSWTGW